MEKSGQVKMVLDPKEQHYIPDIPIFSSYLNIKIKLKKLNNPQWGTENGSTVNLNNISVHSVSFQLTFVYHFVNYFGNGQDDLLRFLSKFRPVTFR